MTPLTLLLAAGAAVPTPATFFFGIKSGVSDKYAERRNRWRASDCSDQYAAAGIAWKFFVGAPLDDGHTLFAHQQGAPATETEAQRAVQLRNENAVHGDMRIIPWRDQYMDVSYKLVDQMAYGYWFTNATFIGTHDDEYCLDVPKLRTLAATKLPRDQLLYAGNYMFSGTEYAMMKGPTGVTAPFFSGWAYFLQRELVDYAVIRSWDRAVLHQDYGTSSDDANMGKWVAHAVDAYGIRVKMAQAKIVTEI
jgi:hypothetical protein